MSKFNFDSEFFRRVISKCEKAEKISSLSSLVKEATEFFYDEYDYYPDLAAYAPGTFTIMGNHLEYVKGNLVQAALPLGTVLVGKSLCSVKCKLYTSSKDVEGLKKSVFPITHYKKNLKVFPEWVNYVKGVINNYPNQDIKGFDAVIHSNVPVGQGYGSSAALQVGFYIFLDALVGEKTCEKKEVIGKVCFRSESQLEFCQKKLGFFNSFTSAAASSKSCIRINCRTQEVSAFHMKDINLLFLLTYPNFKIELNDRDLVDERKMELYIAAKLLGLEEIIDATEYHLSVLENMEDPSREEVIKILRDLNIDEELKKKFVENLFFFPKSESVPDDYLVEEDFLEVEYNEDMSNKSNKSEDNPSHPLRESKSQSKRTSKSPSVSHIHRRIAELCKGNVGSKTNLPQRVCEEINCLGGLDNISADSKMTVIGKLLARVRHIITENIRSLVLSDITSQVDYEEFGTKLIQSHLSLKLDFEVSCPTLDTLVQLAIDSDNVYGAKMTSGGGTLTLLHRSVVEKFIEKVTKQFGENFQFYLVFPSSGARKLNMGVRNNPKSTLSTVYLNRDQALLSALKNFEIIYKYKPTHGAYSPDVINLIGDYSDYNHGFYLSAAVNINTVVVGALNGTSKIRVTTTIGSEEESQKIIFPIPECGDVKPGKVKWGKLLRGVVAHFKGFLKGFDCLIESSLPCGSEISSKPALAVAFYTFLEEISGEKTKNPTEKANRCMLAAQEYCSIPYGIGELIVASRAKENFLTLVDCRSTATTFIPFGDPSVTLLITVAEMENRLNLSLLYKRMEECYDVAKALGARTLRCLHLNDLEDPKSFLKNAENEFPDLKNSKKKFTEKAVRRAVHVIKENERALKAAEALKNNDFELLGELMIASHNSLRNNFEITLPQLDCLVSSAMEVDGVMGSKMSCSSSLPCTISLVKRWATDDLIEYLQKSTELKLSFYVVNSCDGCGLFNLKEYLEKLPLTKFFFEHIFPF